MDKFGYIRTAACAPYVELGNVHHNVMNIIEAKNMAKEKGADIIVFPELSLTGYTCGELFRQTLLLDTVEEVISDNLVKAIGVNDPLIVVGTPLRLENRLFNCAVFIHANKVLAVIPKSYLPNNNEFYEKRWFSSGLDTTSDYIYITNQKIPFGTNILVDFNGTKIGAEICEDLWVPIPPSCNATLNGADIILNLSATNELTGKHDYLLNLISQQSARCRCGYIYASAGRGESSTDLVYSGNTIIAEDGNLLNVSRRFTSGSMLAIADIDIERLRNERRNSASLIDNAIHFQSQYRLVNAAGREKAEIKTSLMRYVNPLPFVPSNSNKLDEHCREIISIQCSGLEQRLRATGCKNMVVGLSGGLDSTLAILICHRAFRNLGLDFTGIHAITMPGFGTTDRTYNNALKLIERLGVNGLEINIANAVIQHFSDIDQDINVHDVTYENSQARERTQILMDYANKVDGMVLGTGDLSELALGWCTYNGDQMSMYGVNASVPKTLVKHLVKWIAETDDDQELKTCLLDIIDTPISPELIPAEEDGSIKQKTEDLVGPYELHDFFLYNMLRFGYSPKKIEYLAQMAFAKTYSNATIHKWLTTFYKRFFSQQFKRSCMPDGPKVGSVCLSPRGDWRMPSDISSKLWLQNI
ncbi:MAG: NAD(+) synthase [Prevotella sp.]|nr:NAD(+) synthase [Bacteroides sp.]MCM1366517.1 NAD(+) synthase [Prevotella sp.]